MPESLTQREAFEVLARMCQEYQEQARLAATLALAPWRPDRWESCADVSMTMTGCDWDGRTIHATVKDRETLQGQEFRSIAAHLARLAVINRRQSADEIRQARLSAGGRETGTVRHSPSARAGMVSRVDTTWHGESGYGAGQTENDAYRGASAITRPLPSTLADAGHAALPCIACKRGTLYIREIPSKYRRTLKRLLPKLACGTATPGMSREVIRIIQDLVSWPT